MRRRLAFSVFTVLVVWAGHLFAQTEDLKAYLERGRVLSKAEKYEQALPYFLFALELGEKQFGKDNPTIVPLLNDLAEIYATQRHYRDAEPLYKRSLEIQEQAVAQYQAGIARTLNKLGSIYEQTGRISEAQRLYRRVLTVWQPALGPDDPSVRTARRHLAMLSQTQPPAPPAPGFRVHLTSIRNPADAEPEWTRLQRLYPRLLADLGLVVTRADLGAKRGIYYRIHAGPMEEPRARALCRAFAARGVWCAVVRGPAAPAKPPAVAMHGEVTPPPKPLPGSGFRIHLTSIRDPADAEGEWARLQRLHTELLEGLSLAVIRADLGAARGIWYRIQGGPLTEGAARARCASFAERSVWCRVVRPAGDAAADWMQRQVVQRGRRRDRARGRATRRPWRGRRRLGRRVPRIGKPGAGWAPEPGARRYADKP